MLWSWKDSVGTTCRRLEVLSGYRGPGHHARSYWNTLRKNFNLTAEGRVLLQKCHTVLAPAEVLEEKIEAMKASMCGEHYIPTRFAPGMTSKELRAGGLTGATPLSLSRKL
jgi:hypothetical protein